MTYRDIKDLAPFYLYHIKIYMDIIACILSCKFYNIINNIHISFSQHKYTTAELLSKLDNTIYVRRKININ